MVTLDKYTDLTLENKIETISLEKTEEVLNTPSFWYPCDQVVIIELTEKGKKYLDEQVSKFKDQIAERLAYKKT